MTIAWLPFEPSFDVVIALLPLEPSFDMVTDVVPGTRGITPRILLQYLKHETEEHTPKIRTIIQFLNFLNE